MLFTRQTSDLNVTWDFPLPAKASPKGLVLRRRPAFLNAALEIRYNREAAELKHGILRPLEERLGRLRTDDRNAPRTLDMDISLFGQQVVHDLDAGLEIPDPEILTRAHVAIPLADLAPATLHPVSGLTLAEIAARFDARGVQICAELALWPQSDKF